MPDGSFKPPSKREEDAMWEGNVRLYVKKNGQTLCVVLEFLLFSCFPIFEDIA